jgi:hypothetical protein
MRCCRSAAPNQSYLFVYLKSAQTAEWLNNVFAQANVTRAAATPLVYFESGCFKYDPFKNVVVSSTLMPVHFCDMS